MAADELLLSECVYLSVGEVAAASGLSAEEIDELIDLGVLEPAPHAGPEASLPAHAIEAARAVRRLQRDFELPLVGAALVLACRERIRELEQRLRLLECLVPEAARPR
ncbi:MAG TPA: chaperone modulator CbpM [Burkholderiales bacterium]